MADQPRHEPLEPSRFFADGRSYRDPVPGTVARGQVRTDVHYLTGMKPAGEAPDAPSLDRRAEYADTFPFPVTAAVMRRGRERFDIYCAVCHGRAGTGRGPVVEAGYPPARSFHDDRLRQAPAGYLFDVVTRGYRQMPAYGGQVPPGDRWAVVAYVRALQLSRHAPLEDLPPEIRQRFADAGE